MVSLIILMAAGAAFGFAFPAAFASIAEALAALSLAGIVTKAVLMIRRPNPYCPSRLITREWPPLR